MVGKKDNIYALSTPPGKSAIAVFRISGEKAYKIIKDMSLSMPKKPNLSITNTIITNKGEKIDRSITTYFKGPRSFTGEDMVEVSLHGGNASVKKFITTLNNNQQIRMAEPGEFTKRAFENNKLDLTQVEAIADIVNAETEEQRKQALGQLLGALSQETKKIQNEIKKILANVEATIDFSDEELPKNLVKKIKEQTKNIIKEIYIILQNSNNGEKIRSGFSVGIVGITNSGKSSFINNISKQDIAIVTKIPGTTRDVLESYVDLRGLPVKFYDTAGIRRTKNNIEKIGIDKSTKVYKNADLNLVFVNTESQIDKFKDIPNKIYIQSKSDIRKNTIKRTNLLCISSKTNHGINRLSSVIFKKLSKKAPKNNHIISRERHKTALEKTTTCLKNSLENKNFDLVAEDIRQGLKEISKIHGSVDIEDILDIIFKDFCIGK
tara:strand:- start:654 stop:1961 length:1308 start_codon:yes stop_codon:yes gene_type:complete